MQFDNRSDKKNEKRSYVCEIQDEVEQDYNIYDKNVNSLKLTDNMRVALECRKKGFSYPEI